MKTTFNAPGAILKVDQCLRCREIWFDKSELESMAHRGDLAELFPAPTTEKLKLNFPSGQRQLVESELGGASLLNMIGLPTEEEEARPRQAPVTTIALILACIMMTVTAMKGGEHLFERWMFFPQSPLRHMGSTLVTSLLLHADWKHLLFNMYFLWMCADNIEEERGPLFLVLAFVFCGMVGHLAYSLTGDTRPSLGASGSIAGLLAYYGFAYPQNRFRIGFAFRIQPKTTPMSDYTSISFSMKAPMFIFVYFLTSQMFELGLQILGVTQINAVAHLGGMAGGALVYFLGF